MASIIDFQNLYTVIKEQLPDLGGLVADFPKILNTVENNAPLAMKYIQNITEKLLQDIASRESVYTEDTTCKSLSEALKSKKTTPPMINQHLDFIILKTSLPMDAKNIDETYAAFESLVSLMQWQHGKYYIASDDDYDMLLTEEDTSVRKFESLGVDPDEFKVDYENNSTRTKEEAFFTADEVIAKIPDVVEDDLFADTVSAKFDKELKSTTEKHRKTQASKTNYSQKQDGEAKKSTTAYQKIKINTSQKRTNEGAKSSVKAQQLEKKDGVKSNQDKPEIKSVKKLVSEKKKEDVPSDVPATIISNDENLRPAAVLSAKAHVKKPNFSDDINENSENALNLEYAGVSEVIKEVYRPTKGPSPVVYGIVTIISIGFLVIGLFWGKTFRDNNIENQVTEEAKYLLEEASVLRTMKSSKNIPDTITTYTKMLNKIDDFKSKHPRWNQAFEETVVSLRNTKDELQNELNKQEQKKETMLLVQEALKSDDLKLIEEALNNVFELLIRYPKLSVSLKPEINKLEATIRKLKRIKDLKENMELAKRQADSLRDTAELSLLYKNLGILKWFFDRLPNDAGLTESLNNLELKVENREEYSEIEIRINYLIGIYDVASKSDDYNEVSVAIDLINESLAIYGQRVDKNPEAPKHLKSLYRELTTKLTLLEEREKELREEEAMMKYAVLTKAVEELRNSKDEVKLRVLVEKIDEFIVKHPLLKNDIEKSRNILMQQLDLIEKIGNSQKKITALIAEATDLLSSENPLEIGAKIVEINEFITELPASKESFTEILEKLDSRKKLIETQMSLNDRTSLLIQKSEQVRAQSNMSEIAGVINEINEFKRTLQSDEKENSYFLMRLEREVKKLSDRFQELRNVKIVIDSPKAGRIFKTREVTVEGRVIDSKLKQVHISLAGWSKTVDVINGSFSTDMMLVSGANIIKVASSSTTYIGETSCEIVCTVARSEFLVKLTWERSDSSGGEGIAKPDLDLYITEPTGKTVYYDDPYGDAGELLTDSREGENPEIYELSTLRGHEIVEGTYFIRVKYAEDRSIPRKIAEPGKKLWAGYLPKPTPVKFKLTIFRKGKFYAEYTGEISRMDYIHNGHEAWLAYPKAWWDKTCPVVISK